MLRLKCSRYNLLGAVALVAASLAPLVPAVAQSSSQPSGMSADDSRAAITVTAPRSRQSGRGTSGAPIQTITTQSVVYIDDLDLRSAAGKAEMTTRVEAAAKEACSWLDEVYPMGNPATTTPQNCRADAIAQAQAQIRAAMARAGG